MRKLAFALYLIFTVSWFLHLPERWPVLAPFRVDLVLVAVITLLLATSAADQQAPARERNYSALLILAIAAYAVVTIPFVQWPGSVVKSGLPRFIKAIVFYFFTVKLATTERRLQSLVLVFAACQTLRVLEPTYLHVTQGYWGSSASMLDGAEWMYRLSGAPSDVVNPNGLAFVVLTAVMFWHYLTRGRPVGRLFYAAFLPVALYALLLTGSRSGMVGLAMMAGVIWWKSRRKVLLGAVLCVAVLAAIPRLSSDQIDRYVSLVSSTAKNAPTSQSRWRGVRQDFVVALRRPLFGHGLGTSLEANSNFRSKALLSHNLYAEVAQELGFVGLLIFLAFLASVGYELRVTELAVRAGPSDNFYGKLLDALTVWFAVNMLFTIASYGLSGYSWYLLAGFAAALVQLQRTAATVPEGDVTGKTGIAMATDSWAGAGYERAPGYHSAHGKANASR